MPAGPKARAQASRRLDERYAAGRFSHPSKGRSIILIKIGRLIIGEQAPMGKVYAWFANNRCSIRLFESSYGGAALRPP